MLRTKGFTLIELLVVISIIALLVALLLPVLSKAKRAAVKAENMSNMTAWSVGVAGYANDNDGYFPYNGSDPNQLKHPEYYSGRGTRTGAGGSWCSTDVQYMWKHYMMPNQQSAKRGSNNVLYNPNIVLHREGVDMNLTGGLIGYFYWPRRTPNRMAMLNRADGYLTKQRFDEGPDPKVGGPARWKLPILQDIMQWRISDQSWIHTQSGTIMSGWGDQDGKGEPEGAHSLFEDGHVQWNDFSEFEFGASTGWFYYNFKLEL